VTDAILYIDLESRSAADLRKTGAHKYWEHETTDLWCACWALGDGEVQDWTPDMPCPPDIAAHVSAGGIVSGWNVGFEKLGWEHRLGPKYGWPVPEREQYRDTAAYAAAMSLPRALGHAAAALGTAAQKDDEGYRLMMRMAKPRKPRKDEDPDALLWWDDDERLQRLIRYCRDDVRTEREIRKALIPLSPAEQAVWEFDNRMNDRGVRIDLDMVRALQRIADKAKTGLDKRMKEITTGEITACSQVSALAGWVGAEMCMKVESLDKNALAALLALDDLPAHVREALELRKEYAKTSTAKLNAMLACTGEDDRARGLHLYHGAGTGRWAGKLIQTQNMPRGGNVIKDPDKAASIMLRGNPDIVDMIYGSPLTAVSDMLRSCLVASPGHRLLAADYSSIEGRVTAWVAGEDWKLAAFVANDEGRGPGMYEINAASIFNMPVEKIGKKSQERQTGKASELALGFGGGVLAYHSMAGIYGIDMAPVYPVLCSSTEPEIAERAHDRYEECLKRGDTGTDLMSREAWIASEMTKVKWRNKHPATVALWKGLEEAAFDAVMTPGTVASYGRIKYVVQRGFLWCMLPSGRCLAYGAPKIQDRKTPWGDTKAAVTAMTVDSVTKVWKRVALYGGLLTENVVQAIARDLMAHGMLTAEAAGYPIVLTVHDEGVADVPNGHGSLREFEQLLCDLPPWAAGLPVVAEGYEALRYKKD